MCVVLESVYFYYFLVPVYIEGRATRLTANDDGCSDQ